MEGEANTQPLARKAPAPEGSLAREAIPVALPLFLNFGTQSSPCFTALLTQARLGALSCSMPKSP